MSSADTGHSQCTPTRPQAGRGREQGRGQGSGQGREQRPSQPIARSSVFHEPLRDLVITPTDYLNELELFAGFLKVFHEEFVDSNFYTIEVSVRTTNVLIRGMRELTADPMPPDVRQFLSLILTPPQGASGPLFSILHPSAPPMVQALKINESRNLDDGQLFAGFLHALDDELTRTDVYGRMDRPSANVLKRGLLTMRQVPLNSDVRALLNEITSAQRPAQRQAQAQAQARMRFPVPRPAGNMQLPTPGYDPLQDTPVGFARPSPAVRARLRAREEAIVHQAQQRARRRG